MDFKFKLRKYSALLICLIFIFILAACTAQKPTDITPSTTPSPATPQVEKQNIGDYLPLNVGNKWEYEGEGIEYASFTQEVVYQKGNKYQVMMDDGGTRMANVIQITSDSLVNVYREGEVYDDKNVLDKAGNINIVMLKLPIAAGTAWTSEENDYEIVDIDASVTVPAGKFDNCIVVRILFKEGTDEMYMHYKKGIGMIQSEFRTKDGGSIFSRLKTYSIIENELHN